MLDYGRVLGRRHALVLTGTTRHGPCLPGISPSAWGAVQASPGNTRRNDPARRTDAHGGKIPAVRHSRAAACGRFGSGAVALFAGGWVQLGRLRHVLYLLGIRFPQSVGTGGCTLPKAGLGGASDPADCVWSIPRLGNPQAPFKTPLPHRFISSLRASRGRWMGSSTTCNCGFNVQLNVRTRTETRVKKVRHQ